MTCSLCRQITRDGNWPVEEILARFQLKREHFGFELTYANCPECGERYWYYYYGRLEDWQHETDFAFTRLDLAQTLESLPADERAGFAAKIPSLVVELEQDLASRDDFVRREAAWKLARHLLASGAWEKLGRLLAHPDEAVFEEAFLLTFRKPDRYDPPEPPPGFVAKALPDALASSLARGRASTRGQIRGVATFATCERAVARGATDELASALESKDPDVASTTLGYLTYRASPLLDGRLTMLLSEWLKSGDDSQARSALKLLARDTKDGTRPPFALIVDCLENGRVAVRQEAAEQLLSWARTTNEKERAVKHLAGLLEDADCGGTAMDQLKRWAERGEPAVATIIPHVVAYVQAKKQRWQTGMEVLRCAQSAGIDISAIYPFITQGIGAGDWRAREASSNILNELIRRGVDLGRFRTELEAGLDAVGFDSYGEQLAIILVGVYLGEQDWAALKKLLVHSNPHVPGHVAFALEESSLDIGPLVPALVDALFAAGELTRRWAGLALQRQAAQSKEASRLVLAALDRSLERNPKQTPGLADAIELADKLRAPDR